METLRKRKAGDDDTSAQTKKCRFGELQEEECHRNVKPEIKCFQSLTVEDQIVLKWRAGLSECESSIETICRSHKWYFAEQFKRQFTKCCNAFGKHTKKVKGGHVVTVDIATELRNKNIEVIPGWQLCRSCYEETK